MIKRPTRIIFLVTIKLYDKLFNIYHIEVDKILISQKNPYGKESSFKYFLGYNDDDIIRPLCIKISQIIGCVNHFDSNKTMSF